MATFYNFFNRNKKTNCNNLTIKLNSFLLFMLMVVIPISSNGRIVYVNGNLSSGLNDGTSWLNAYSGKGSLSNALKNANSGDTLWVASGTYSPIYDQNFVIPTNRGDITFNIKSGIRLFGGFAGSETSISQSNWKVNQTNLSGSYNADHVVSVYNQTDIVRIEGFTIRDGYTNSTFSDIQGGGIMLNGQSDSLDRPFIIRNCVITNNTSGLGGGIFAIVGKGGLILDGCDISKNTSRYGGGIELFSNGKILISNSFIRNNEAIEGGGLLVSPSDSNNIKIWNTVFYGNTTNKLYYGFGGAISIRSTYGSDSAEIINCSFINNITIGDAGSFGAPSGAAIYGGNKKSNIKNSIFYGNRNSISTANNQLTFHGTIYNSIIDTPLPAGVIDGGNNSQNASVSFKNIYNLAGQDSVLWTADDGLSLKDCFSPAINTGNNSYANNILYDIAGQNRIQDNIIDAGAYEYNISPSSLPTLTISTTSLTTICQGNSIVLNTNVKDVHNFQWSLNGNIIPGATSSNYYSYNNISAGGNYVVSGTDCSGNKINSSEIVVTVNPMPTINISGNLSICQGSSTTLTASGASSYLWYPSSNLNHNNLSVVIANPTVNTLYSVAGTANGCISNVIALLTINPLPTIKVSSNVTINLGNSTTLTVSGAQSYNWLPQSGLNKIIGSSVVANPTISTTYTISGTDLDGCTNISLVKVTVRYLSDIQTFLNVNSIQIYPNPNKGQFTINVEDPRRLSNTEIIIYDLLGNTVSSLKLSSAQTEIDLSSQPKGIYYLKIGDKEGYVGVKKIIVQ